ncbi:MAG: serine/threonine protein kinase [Planctomycetes bacterium]|nr:serine/threonine protein kinase [Planctomycetota bacterium]MCB9886153.1 serine/threonine protein kinase [Planctomycetota bacterium]
MENRDLPTPDPADRAAPDWEAFYASYRKPGYVPGYEITSKLGGGQFGLVFRARKQSIGKDYAIKFLQVDDGEVRRAIRAELDQLRYFAQLDHPNLVSIEDRGEVDGIPYLVMAFAGTDTLQGRLQQHVSVAGVAATGAARDELLHFFLQTCRGVAALHEHSLVHFDLKPANVFVRGDVARVGDFGLSKLVTHSRGSLSVGRGTPYYMAPELLQRRGDARSDIYSLGVMLYEILCGQLPFRGDTEWQVLRQHETEPPPLPSHLSAGERALLRRCLAKDPAARFQSVHDLLAAFGAPSSGGPSASAAAVMAAAPPPPPPASGGAECVPPLPAASELPPPPAARAKARRTSSFPAVVVLLLFAFVGFRWVSTVQQSQRSKRRAAVAYAEAGMRRAEDAAARRGPVAVLTDGSDPLQSQLLEFVAAAQRDVRTAEQRRRRADLVAPHLAGDDPPDLAACGDLVDRLADAPTFSAGHATKLARNGYGVFVAAVQRLQEFDYQDLRDCHRADHVTRLLAQLANLPSMVAAAPDGEPTSRDECRLRAVAAAWRTLCERFAADEAAYSRLVARGEQHEGAATRVELR